MAATFRQIVNNVLTNIGETNIPAANTTVTDTYQLQVCNFVNHIKEEVENANQWTALWNTYNVVYTAGNTTQKIVDNVTAASPNSGCSIVRRKNEHMPREVALCFDLTSFATPFPLNEYNLADIIYYNTVLAQSPVAYSPYFSVQDLGGDVVNLIVAPAANQNRTIQITLFNPQSRIDPTLAGSTGGLDTPILAPNFPIELGSSWYALQERGESLGTSSMFSEERYREALDDAIGRDMNRSGDIVMVLS
jgi:hypothetical protein